MQKSLAFLYTTNEKSEREIKETIPLNIVTKRIKYVGINLPKETKDLYAENYACMHAKSLQSCDTLCDPTDCSPPGSSIRGILQARILEWVAIPFFRGSSRPRDQTQVSHIVSRRFTV